MIQKVIEANNIKNGDCVINNNGLKIVTGTRVIDPKFNDVPSLAEVSGNYVDRYKDRNYYTA